MTTNQGMLRDSYLEALDLMIMSVYKPDHELRTEASRLGCLSELLKIREDMLELLHDMRKEATIDTN